MADANQDVIRRFYDELWNCWDFALADTLLAPDLTFRGSFGITLTGREAFKDYMRTVRAAFPDFVNTVEHMVSAGDEVVARLEYRGTHRGELFGIPPTGVLVTYPGIAWFRVAGGRVASGWVVGDTLSVVRQIGGFPASR